MSRDLARRSSIALFIGLLCLVLCSMSCASRPANQDLIDQLQESIQISADNAESEKVFESSVQMASLKPRPVQRVWALGHALQSARTLKKDGDYPRLIAEIDEALTDLNDEIPFDETNRESPARRSYVQAELGLREINENMFYRWDSGKGDTSELVVKTFQLAGEVYRKYFTDAILYASVLWRDAEYLFATGENLKAVELYEQVVVKDFEGKFASKARDRIAEIWVAESNAIPFPTDVKTPTEIPSPHKEWLDISNRQLKTSIPDEEKREIVLRQAKLQLAFGHIDKGYILYEGLSKGSRTDDAAEAFGQLLNHALHKNSIEAYNGLYAKHDPEIAPYLWQNEVSRKHLLAIGHDLFKGETPHKEEGYRLLTHLSHSKKDQIAIDAAIALIEYAAVHEAKNKAQFRTIRKDLQDDKFLWKDTTFRVKVFKLKEEIEGS